MPGIGDICVSSHAYNPDRQMEEMQADKLFTDHASGKDILKENLIFTRGILPYIATYAFHNGCFRPV